ncbi:MAG: phytoene desaturase family protein [Saprospiraceae bacterium]
MAKKVVIIGSGFAGLSAACCLAKAGCEVTVLEKNSTPGGRARQLQAEGFHFDMGPSWYWMPDVFERFFAEFDKKPRDFYDLVRLDPSYRVFFEGKNIMDLPAGVDAVQSCFENIEPGSSPKLQQFLAAAQFKYEFGMREFVHRPGHSPLEFFDLRVFKAVFRLQLFRSISREVRSLFKDSRLVRLLEFPVLFLGSTPEKTPALYSLMNYADMVLGTWYPMGGMAKIVDAMFELALEMGVKFEFGCKVEKIQVENGRVTKLLALGGREFAAAAVVAAADYHHVEQELLEKQHRQYSERYWRSRVMAPSCLLFFLGVKGRLKNLRHHNLFFDSDFRQHAREIYESPVWPSDPLFYVCAPSVTDTSVAPSGCENLFVLIPIASDLADSEAVREKYYQLVMGRLEDLTGQNIRDQVVFKQSFGGSDFKSEYHAFRGNAYGLANTLLQTAFLKPKMKNKKVKNLFFAGQLSVPGPGVPPALISGQIVAKEVLKILHD